MQRLREDIHALTCQANLKGVSSTLSRSHSPSHNYPDSLKELASNSKSGKAGVVGAALLATLLEKWTLFSPKILHRRISEDLRATSQMLHWKSWMKWTPHLSHRQTMSLQRMLLWQRQWRWMDRLNHLSYASFVLVDNHAFKNRTKLLATCSTAATDSIPQVITTCWPQSAT